MGSPVFSKRRCGHPLRRPSLLLYTAEMLFYQFVRSSMTCRIQQAQTIPLNSTAGPLPTGATGTQFPLTVGSARCIQEADFNSIFDADPPILWCVNTVFRCRQRKCRADR